MYCKARQEREQNTLDLYSADDVEGLEQKTNKKGTEHLALLLSTPRMHMYYTKADSYICRYHSTTSNQTIHCEIYTCGSEHFALYTTDTSGKNAY